MTYSVLYPGRAGVGPRVREDDEQYPVQLPSPTLYYALDLGDCPHTAGDGRIVAERGG